MNPLSLTQGLLGFGVPVLCYHQVRPRSGMTPEKFGRHLDLIAALGFRTVGLAELHRIILGRERAPEPVAVITFDDCTVDNWIFALPELASRKMTATFFAVTGFLDPGAPRLRADQGGQADVPAFGEIMRLAMQDQRQWFMNHDELRSMVHDFGMDVYSHSATHQACFTDTRAAGILSENGHWSHGALCGKGADPNMPVHPVGSAYAHAGFGLDWNGTPLRLGTPEERLTFCLNDFSCSKTRLEHILGRPCPYLCLPWGQYDDVTLQAAKQAGYSAVLTLDRGAAGSQTTPLRIGRRAVSDRKTLAWLALRLLKGAHERLWRKS